MPDAENIEQAPAATRNRTRRQRTGPARALAGLLFALLALGWSPAGPAWAQPAEDAAPNTYITPFPERDTYRVRVIGDSYGEGILEGLTELIGADVRLDLPKKHRQLNGLVRDAFEDDAKALEDALPREPAHVSIAMIGAWDRSSVRGPTGKRHQVGTPEWLALYGQRVDRVMKALRRDRSAVYWVGLPVVRRWEANEHVQMMNEVIREKAFINGVRYIDAYAGFVNEDGEYDSFGPDLSGKQRKMREGDGVLFTADGYRKLAHFVERELRRDLAQATAARNVPLLGGEAEQRKVSPKSAAASAAPSAAGTAGVSAFSTTVVPAQRPLPEAPQGTEIKADHGRASIRQLGGQGREETVSVEILRPAIPANVVALVARQQSPDKPALLGETLTSRIDGGVFVMSSVTPSGAAARQRQAPTQQPYYRVMVRGERLPPKPGRADDFPWPRPDAVEEQAATPPAARDGRAVARPQRRDMPLPRI